MRIVAVLFGLVVLVQTPAFAAAAPAPAPPPIPGVQEVTVVAPQDPKVASTYPTEGQTVQGGVMVLKITFDQSMTPEAWSYSTTPKGQFPDCLARPRLLNDKRTFVLLCSLAVDATYALQVNAAPQFVSAAGRLAAPFQLSFKTSDLPTISLHDALLAAGLTDSDDPIMASAAAPGAVQSKPIKDPAHPPSS